VRNREKYREKELYHFFLDESLKYQTLSGTRPPSAVSGMEKGYVSANELMLLKSKARFIKNKSIFTKKNAKFLYLFVIKCEFEIIMDVYQTT
jgi:hypothetical protein